MNTFTQIPIPSLSHFSGVAILAGAAAGLVQVARSRCRPSETASLPRRRRAFALGATRWGIIAALTLVASLGFGIDLQGLWSTVAAALSLVAIGFVAMWSILSHMLAAILIIIFRPFEIGDRVELLGGDAVLGEVSGLNPVYTTLTSEDGGTLLVPNNLFFQKTLKRHLRANRT